MIEEIIKNKGRFYQFEGNVSIYYFVGDIFKRNYNLLYESIRN
jgi:hypothetical protein